MQSIIQRFCWSLHQRGNAGKLAERVSINSKNFLKIRTFPNYASTPVHWRLLKKDNSSLHVKKKKNPMKWRIYVESARCLEAKRHPEWEGGFSEPEDRPSLGCEGLLLSRTFTFLQSWSNLCFGTKQFLVVNGINEYVTEMSETISLESVEHRVTGNLLRRLGHNESLLWHCLPLLFLFVKDNG